MHHNSIFQQTKNHKKRRGKQFNPKEREREIEGGRRRKTKQLNEIIRKENSHILAHNIKTRSGYFPIKSEFISSQITKQKIEGHLFFKKKIPQDCVHLAVTREREREGECGRWMMMENQMKNKL